MKRSNVLVAVPWLATASVAMAAGSGPLAYDGHEVYAGVAYADTTLTVKDSGAGSLAPGHYGGAFVDLRAGWRLLKAANLEVHGGLPVRCAAVDSVRQSSYYAAFVVPTATLLSALEIAFPIGYSRARLRDDAGGAASLSGVSFGLRLELPLARYAPLLDGLRLSGGGTLYDSKSRARYYGFEGGLRYDFGL